LASAAGGRRVSISFGEKKGMGLIGVFMLLIVTGFFWTMFYIVLNQIMANFLPTFFTDANTVAFYNSCLKPVWHALPFLFFLAMIIWSILQTQNPYNMFTVGGIWIAIAFGWMMLSMVYVVMDVWIMQTLPTMLPMDAIYSGVYTDLVMMLWRTMPWAIAIVLGIFGLYMGPAMFEMGGQTWQTRGGQQW
jgi:hypothetical protein